MRIVTPYRPFAPESQSHLRLGDFDWHDALWTLAESAKRASGANVVQITDVDTPAGPIASLRYATTHRRLMLWILDISLAYLQSDDFDRDTVMLSPDALVFGDLTPGFRADLGVIVRTTPKFQASGRPLLNGAQWWRVAAKARLVAFYREVLALAETLPDDRKTWGADTDPLVALLTPVTAGLSERAGLAVYGHPEGTLFSSLRQSDADAIDAGRQPAPPAAPIVDFKYLRKRHLRRYFDATVGTAVPA
ncbi:MAG: hypothetical protein AB7R67_18965 [Vicinamibacterales bacterium]